MCGSYSFDPSADGRFKMILDELAESMGPDELENLTGSIYPKDDAIVMIDSGHGIVPQVMRWGFPGFSGRRSIINARIETVDVKPIFSESFRLRRCAALASGFYEWDDVKRKYLFTREDGGMYLAGIYTRFNDVPCYCILTTEANDSVSPVHSRMPVVLTHDMLDAYLNDYDSAHGFAHGDGLELGSTVVDDPFRNRARRQRSLF